MKKIFRSIIVAIMFTSCSNSDNEHRAEPNPLWKEFANELKLQFGQTVKINENIKAIVIDITQDEGGIWYGLCYLTNDRLFGRQIPNGIIFTSCMDMLDVTYLNESRIDLITKLDLLNLTSATIRIGSMSPATELGDLIRDYEYGLERRKLKQTPCNEEILGLNAIRECYFDLKDYVN